MVDQVQIQKNWSIGSGLNWRRKTFYKKLKILLGMQFSSLNPTTSSSIKNHKSNLKKNFNFIILNKKTIAKISVVNFPINILATMG
jgi:hydrogenase maturation factor